MLNRVNLLKLEGDLQKTQPDRDREVKLFRDDVPSGLNPERNIHENGLAVYYDCTT